MIKYRATRNVGIYPVEVIRETEHSVYFQNRRGFVGERRAKKVTAHDSYHDSWEAAKSHLLAYAEVDVSTARLRLQYAEKAQRRIASLTPPAEA
jgi:hypothetical protein